MRRFEQECEFLSTIRHPNIIQYLGIYQDPATGLPALLMELMDDCLTHFLESSPQPIPYHIQVNICHDITLALTFLHSNDIVHRDLSSNNVLLTCNAVRAKVTDFGMARLSDQNTRATQLTLTMCPGTDAYMPPEAVQEEPVYTDKIDCFSFGVITIQILTRQFPNPGNRRKRVQVNHPGLPSGTLEMVISEVERRQNHIGEIDQNHTLLQVAIDCLKDRDIERPLAQQLCERVAALKEGTQYSESVRVVEARSTAEQGRSDERDRELRLLRQRHGQQIQGLQQIIQSQTARLEEKEQTIAQTNQTLRQKDETIFELRQQVIATQQQERRRVEEKEREIKQKVGKISQLEREKNQAIEEKDRELGHVYRLLKESEQVSARFPRQIPELEQKRPATETTSRNKEQNSGRPSIKLTWREGKKAPCKMNSSHCAAVDGSTLYVRSNGDVYAYTVGTSSWSRLPNSPTEDCPSVIINNLLTLVGGKCSRIITNQLFSLTGESRGRRWTEEFPSMPTKRCASAALCTETALIVAGGWGIKDSSILQIIEVLNTETLQWSAAAYLPKPLYEVPAAICGDHVYILGESNMYTCSVPTLIQSSKSFIAGLKSMVIAVWKEVAAPPVTLTTCVSIHGRLLAIGGRDADQKSTTGSTTIYTYNPTTDSWEIIGHMATPRSDCIAAVLPNNLLMIVGGSTDGVGTDSVEFATVE